MPVSSQVMALLCFPLTGTFLLVLATTPILESFIPQENHFVLTARAAKSGGAVFSILELLSQGRVVGAAFPDIGAPVPQSPLARNGAVPW